jgi:hypothetical protein
MTLWGKMVHKILADLVVLLHFLWIVFLFGGAFWGARNKTARILHLGGLFFALIIQISNWYCPLTYLEVWLRSKHNPGLAYTGSFILFYIEKIVYLDLPRSLILLFTLFLSGFNGWFYLKKKGGVERRPTP